MMNLFRYYLFVIIVLFEVEESSSRWEKRNKFKDWTGKIDEEILL